MKAKLPKIKISRAEYDFSEVTDKQLQSCVLHELAREKIRRDPELNEKYHRLQGTAKGASALYREVSREVNGPHGSAILFHNMLETPFSLLASEDRDWATKQHLSFAVDLDAIVELAKAEECSFEAFKKTRTVHAETFYKAPDLTFGYFCLDLNYPKKGIKEKFSKWLDSQLQGRGTAKHSKQGLTEQPNRLNAILHNIAASRLIRASKSVEAAMSLCKSEDVTVFEDKKDWNTAEDKLRHHMSRYFVSNYRPFKRK
jgi:hypothetical protein